MNAATGRRVEVGRVVGVHGVRGGVKLESWTEPRSRIFTYQPWWLVWPDGSERCIEGARGGDHGKGMLAQVPEIDDREAAVALVGARILVPRQALPATEPGEFYWTDLEGLAVVTVDDVALGRVDHLVATGANDVLVVVGEDGRERLVPFVPEVYVKDVDLDGGRMVVDWDPEF